MTETIKAEAISLAPTLEEIFQRGTLTWEDVNQTDHKGYGLTPFLLSCCPTCWW